MKQRATWIKVKRGILDPKHRDKMGIAIWLYLQLMDWTNWECGSILTYRDQDAADALEVPIRTIRDWRRKLEDAGYIETVLKKDHQKVRIKNWTNPREYDGTLYNTDNGTRQAEIEYKPSKGYEKPSPSDMEEAQGYIKGDTKGDTKGYSKNVTPTLDSHITNHKPQDIPTQEDPFGIIAFQKTNDQLDLMKRTFFSRNEIHERFWDAVTATKDKKLDGKTLVITVPNNPFNVEWCGRMNATAERLLRAIAAAKMPWAAVRFQVYQPPEEGEQDEGKT